MAGHGTAASLAPIAAASTSSRRSASPWPFWLLLAAWVCAHSPQTATHAVLAWLAEARTFSHQQMLSRQVAHLLGGESAGSAERLGKAEATQTPSPAIPIPAGAALKKIDLALETAPPLRGPAFAWAILSGDPGLRDEQRPATPPHEPPRRAA